ncbi:MAG TPA: AAA family ATPase [Planctomycetota bacterium]|nr:AAA family ATPase [Planctomycetota bacterium]
MKILQLEVEGFRSLKHVVWKPGDLNVVIGPNASGKSNLLKVLEMLRAAAQGRLGNYVIHEGGMVPMLWDGTAGNVKIELALALPALVYRICMTRLGTSGAHSIESEALQAEQPNGQYSVLFERSSGCVESFEQPRSKKPGQFSITGFSIKGPDSDLRGEAFLSSDAGVRSELRLRVREQVRAWRAYQDFRTDPKAPVRGDTISRYEAVLDADGENLVPVLHTLYTGSRQFKTDLHLAMQAGLGDDFEELVFPPSADQRIQMRIRWRSLKTEQAAASLSDGTLRFLFLIAILANPEPAPLIAIDEPETGLHPAMMPIVAELAAEAAKRSQVILTTHSPEFLNGFYKIATPTVSVAECREGHTLLRVLEGEELKYWLKRYSLGELFRSTELEQME